MILRAARPEDARAIAGIHNEIISETLVTFTTDLRSIPDVEHQIENQPVIVAQSAEQVTGFASLGRFRNGPGYRHTGEHMLHVAPGFRSQGIGATLLAQVEAIARMRGIQQLIAGISSANPRSEQFHAAHGFLRVGHLPNVGHKFGQWLDLILMQKDLRVHGAPDSVPDKG